MRGLLLVFSLTHSPAAPPADGWLSSDKLKHFFSAAFVQSIGYGSLRAAGAGHGEALAGATITTTAVGVGKELHDRRMKGEFSVRDLVWDAAGAGSVTVLLVRTR